MLDHEDYIARYDKEDALSIIAELPGQLTHSFAPTLPLSGFDNISNIVLTGMGGSAQPAEFIKTWLNTKLKLPLVISRDYELPGFVSETTLVIVASYSGNTEETLSALEYAKERGSKIVIMTSGGKLLDLSQQANIPAYILPADLQPRFAVFLAVKALASLLESLKFTSGAVAELNESGPWLRELMLNWAPAISTDANPAKQIAQSIVGHSAVVYSGPSLGFAAIKWKIAFNENSKNIAFTNFFPELNHNEFTGWLNPSKHGYKVIELRSNLDHPQTIKRFDVTNRLLSNRFAPIQIQAYGSTILQQLIWTIALGEYTATYLALLNGVDPTPVELVEKFKAELTQ